MAAADTGLLSFRTLNDFVLRQHLCRFLRTLHIDGRVYEVLCEKGDLIGVPDGTPHWFDMSESPYFIAIRLFTNTDGWVADFTGEDIAERFPRMTPHPSATT